MKTRSRLAITQVAKEDDGGDQIVVVCAAFGLTVLEAKTEIMCFYTKGMSEFTVIFSVKASGQMYNKTNGFVRLGGGGGGGVNHNTDLIVEVNPRMCHAEAVMRRRRILCAGFMARMEDTRLLKCVMFGELVGCTECVGGNEKEWVGCLLEDLRAFGIDADQWTTAAQVEEGLPKTEGHWAERLMVK